MAAGYVRGALVRQEAVEDDSVARIAQGLQPAAFAHGVGVAVGARPVARTRRQSIGTAVNERADEDGARMAAM